MKTVLMALMSLMLVSVGVVWGAEPSVKSSPAPVGAPSVEHKMLSLEVEGFNLTNASVQDLEGASGGKVVVLNNADSKAEKTIQLSKGNYKVTVYVLGPLPRKMLSTLKLAVMQKSGCIRKPRANYYRPRKLSISLRKQTAHAL